MRAAALLLVALSTSLLGCGGAAPPAGAASASAALTPAELVANRAKYEGKKVTVRGIYTQGYEKGSVPAHPWALVVKTARKDEAQVDCLIPATQDRAALAKGNDPTVTVEGTAHWDPSGPGGMFLEGCSYTIH